MIKNFFFKQWEVHCFCCLLASLIFPVFSLLDVQMYVCLLELVSANYCYPGK